MAQHGGNNNVNDEQLLMITEKLATFGTKVDNLADIVKEMKRELATKAELNALEKRVTGLETANENRKEAPYKAWMLVASVGAVASVIISALSLIHAWSK